MQQHKWVIHTGKHNDLVPSEILRHYLGRGVMSHSRDDCSDKHQGGLVISGGRCG